MIFSVSSQRHKLYLINLFQYVILILPKLRCKLPEDIETLSQLEFANDFQLEGMHAALDSSSRDLNASGKLSKGIVRWQSVLFR
jgi:hypothetical protein